MSEINLNEMFLKQADDLVNLFHKFDDERNVEFIKKYPEIWNDVYDIEVDSRYHRAMKSIAKQSYTAALSDLQGKVDGLLEALEIYAKMSPRTQAGDDTTWKAKQALAEFKKDIP